MRIDNDIPWWSSKWFAFVVVMIYWVVFFTFLPKELTKTECLFFIPISTILLYEGWQRMFLLRPPGIIWFLTGLTLLMLNCSLFIFLETSYIFAYWLPGVIAFSCLKCASDHTYRNRLDWSLCMGSYNLFPAVYYLERFYFGSFLGPNSVILIPVKQANSGNTYIVLSDFDSWPTVSKTIKDGRREVIIGRLKEFCFREGIQVVESAIE